MKRVLILSCLLNLYAGIVHAQGASGFIALRNCKDTGCVQSTIGSWRTYIYNHTEFVAKWNATKNVYATHFGDVPDNDFFAYSFLETDTSTTLVAEYQTPVKTNVDKILDDLKQTYGFSQLSSLNLYESNSYPHMIVTTTQVANTSPAVYDITVNYFFRSLKTPSSSAIRNVAVHSMINFSVSPKKGTGTVVKRGYKLDINAADSFFIVAPIRSGDGNDYDWDHHAYIVYLVDQRSNPQNVKGVYFWATYADEITTPVPEVISVAKIKAIETEVRSYLWQIGIARTQVEKIRNLPAHSLASFTLYNLDGHIFQKTGLVATQGFKLNVVNTTSVFMAVFVNNYFAHGPRWLVFGPFTHTIEPFVLLGNYSAADLKLSAANFAKKEIVLPILDDIFKNS